MLPACLLDGRGVHYYFSPKFTRIWEKKQSIWEKGKAPSPSERLDEFLWLDDAAQPGFAVPSPYHPQHKTRWSVLPLRIRFVSEEYSASAQIRITSLNQRFLSYSIAHHLYRPAKPQLRYPRMPAEQAVSIKELLVLDESRLRERIPQSRIPIQQEKIHMGRHIIRERELQIAL